MTDTWEPQFPGQRPPFTPGNTVTPVGNTRAVTHGALSSRIVGEASAEMLAELRTAGATWVDEVDRVELEAWLYAEAACRLLRGYVDRHGLLDRTGKPRHAADLLLRFESRAAKARATLGLNPAARAALGRDTAVARNLAQTGVEQVAAAGRRAREEATARGATSPTGDTQ